MSSLFKLLGHSKRLTSFAAFGATGVLLTATWAAGVTTTTAGATDPNTSGAIALTLPTGDDPALDAAISVDTADGLDAALPINFVGRWGNIPADAVDGGTEDPDTGGDWELFDINLTGIQDGTRDFFLEVTLGNTPDDFTVLQIEFVKVDLACGAADLDNTGATGYNAQTLYVESNDSTAVFNFVNVAVNQMCVGVADTAGADAKDADGTYIRRNDGSTTAPSPMPQFTAVLGEYDAG